MKWFCTFLFCFFLHTRGYFSDFCTLVMDGVFSPPAWRCVYFHALQSGVCIFMPFSVMREFPRLYDCVCIFAMFMVDGVCIPKLSWSCFDLKQLSLFTASYEEIKVQIWKKCTHSGLNSQPYNKWFNALPLSHRSFLLDCWIFWVFI